MADMAGPRSKLQGVVIYANLFVGSVRSFLVFFYHPIFQRSFAKLQRKTTFLIQQICENLHHTTMITQPVDAMHELCTF
ncbi:transmembrane protein, putative [Medicago truncatula]|uniref:Transmembrane protein, putative n=1 Tax=Medicago truncatula TaxID=3880 RepID=G7JRM9_MEDTR|nr:transmembrane protein, putative [Medicago truncatula]